MENIVMLPDPTGGWVMMCACGAAEIRSINGPRWASFDLKAVAGDRYRVTCRTCGQATEHQTQQQAWDSIQAAAC